MNKSLLRALVLTLALLLGTVSTAACTADNEMTLTFDGTNCVYEGPSELATGSYQITGIDTSEIQGWVSICRGDEGYSWQDMLDHDFTDDDDVDKFIEWPSWCLAKPSKSVLESDEGRTVNEYKFRHPGLYFLLWEEINQNAAWKCAPLTVVKATSE